MPEPYKSWFNSPIKLLIGNKISLAIIPPKHMWSYIEELDVIYDQILNIDYLGYDLDFILTNISSFLSRLGLSMSVNGAMLMEGPFSHKTVHQRSELVGVTDEITGLEKALECVEKALEINPDYAIAQETKNYILSKLNP